MLDVKSRNSLLAVNKLTLETSSLEALSCSLLGIFGVTDASTRRAARERLPNAI